MYTPIRVKRNECFTWTVRSHGQSVVRMVTWMALLTSAAVLIASFVDFLCCRELGAIVSHVYFINRILHPHHHLVEQTFYRLTDIMSGGSTCFKIC